jgi:transcriptional regulator with PAS, ATPase and Fis domain
MFAGDVYKLLEGTAEAAFVVTLEGEICFWNTSAEQLFGYTAENVLNKRCQEVLQGKSSLGAAVCKGESSVQRCGPWPTNSSFRSRGCDAFWTADMDQCLHNYIRGLAAAPTAHSASGSQHQRP